MNEFLEVFLSVIVGFCSLLFLVRLIGNKQISQMNIFTYISGIVIGSMMADTLLHDHLHHGRTLFGIAIWVGLLHFFEFLNLKSVKARELLDGQPVILIKKGVLMRQAMKKQRINIDDLTMMMRKNNVFDISAVEYAILEAHGELSILQKKEKKQYLPTGFIIDGIVIEKRFQEQGWSSEIFLNELFSHYKLTANETFYAELQSDQTFFIQSQNGDVIQSNVFSLK